MHPTLIKKSSYVASIDGVLNAVIVNGNPVGQSVIQGEGAGPAATTSALISDISSILRGNSYYGDLIKTLIIGFMCYIIGFAIVVLHIIVFMSMSMDVDGIAMFYYLMLGMFQLFHFYNILLPISVQKSKKEVLQLQATLSFQIIL